jgi:hypothetical protein
MPRWIVPAALNYSGAYTIDAATKEEAIAKLQVDDVLDDPFADHPSGGDVETFDDEIEQLKEEHCQQAKPCQHDKIDLEPADIEYGVDGSAAVWQRGQCLQCHKRVQLNYAISEVTEEEEP